MQCCTDSEARCYNYRFGFCVCSQALRHKSIKFSSLETIKGFLYLII